MSTATSAIAWTDRTWNPIRGCSRVSPGCDGCYAMGQAHRFSHGPVTDPSTDRSLDKPAGPFHRLTTIRNGKVDWTGKVVLVEKALGEPLRWRKPARVFVNSMSDLFHPALTNAEIAAVFGVMAACPHLTFQILTKRAERMREWFEWIGVRNLDDLQHAAFDALNANRNGSFARTGPYQAVARGTTWPLPNVWLGVSAEDQQRADERIPHLLATPAAVRFVSCEPLLGPIALTHYFGRRCARCGDVLYPDQSRCDDPCAPGASAHFVCGGEPREGLDWLIVGGESGPRARPFDVAWARSMRDACKAAGVAYFCKQLGANVRDRNDAGYDGQEGDAWDLGQRLFDRNVIEHNPDGVREDYQGAPVRIRLVDRAGADPAEWPAGLRVQEFPEVRP